MNDLKLARLPDRVRVKIAVTVSPDLNRALHLYAEIYRETYGQAESVPELIPYMLQCFLDNDRGFAKARRERDAAGDGASAPIGSERVGKKRRAGLSESPAADS